MQEMGNPLFEPASSADSGLMEVPAREVHLEDMSAKAIKRLEYVFKIAEERDGPLTYETFRNVLQAVLGHRVGNLKPESGSS